MHHAALCSHADIDYTGGRQNLRGIALLLSLTAAGRKVPLGRLQTTAQAPPIFSTLHKIRRYQGRFTIRPPSKGCLAGQY